jgi:TonB-dependent starch-binding outer membrane protein SusC
MKKFELFFSYIYRKNQKLVRTMKLILILLTACFIQVSASVYSQVTKFTFDVKNQQIEEVLRQIEDQSKFRFFYQREQVDVERKVTFKVTEQTVHQVLGYLFEGQDVTFDVRNDNLILIKDKNEPYENPGFWNQTQQQRTVSGRITDQQGEPLPGVTIVVKGTTQGTITDSNGEYSISNLSSDAILVFSFVGMRTQEVLVGSQATINITMEEETIGIEEVVAIGYGTQRKRDITAAISNIDVSRLEDVPAVNISRLLVGQSTGVQVKQLTGAPGGEFDVTIRGLSSLGAGSQPLWVIDGFPVGTSIGQNFNPDDIESISVLKDAVSTAIYGARGSNGVILITTKSAKEGKARLNFKANYGVQNIPESRKVEMLNGEEFAQFKKDIFMDKIRIFDEREPSIEEVPLDFRYPEQTKYSTNWFDEILNQNAQFQDYNLTISEGSGDIRSLVSLGVINQEGALKNTNFNNYSVRANVNGKINDFINVGLNFNGSYSKQNYTTSEGYYAVVGMSLLADPREPVFNEDGTYNSYIGGHDGIYGFPNPVQYLNEIQRNSETGDLLANGFIEFSFLKDFKFKSIVNARRRYATSKQYVPSTVSGTNSPAPRDASEDDAASNVGNYAADELLTYNKQFEDHSLNVLLGFSAQQEIVKGLSGAGDEYPNDLTPFLGSATLQSSNSYEYGWTMLAYFTRINYSFKDKYLLSGTFRREGSSRFGSNNKYGNFPALSLGWRISDEPFMSGISWLDDLKPRISWGQTGNNNIGNYSHLSFMSKSGYILSDNYVSGYGVSSFANTELGWEKAEQIDVGLDLSAFNNRFTFTAEYYKRITSDMLLSIELPAISGFTSSLNNVGKVRNSGVEIETGYRNRINDDLNVWGNFNISFNRNKVLEMRGENDEIWNGSMWDGGWHTQVGRPIGMIVGYEVIGIFDTWEQIDEYPTQEGAVPGDFIYRDVNDDGKIDHGLGTADMTEIGNPWPKFTGGLTVGADYKNFDVSVLFTYAYDFDLYRRIEVSTMNLDGVFNVLAKAKERWRSAENPGNGIVPSTNNWKWHRESSSFYVYDGSNLWVKNVSLGYTLPKSLLQSFDARIYLTADNLFIFTDYPGNNPDVSHSGTHTQPNYDAEAYPLPRTFTIGANITF